MSSRLVHDKAAMYELPSDLQHSLRSYRGSVRLSREGVPTSHFDALHDLEDQPQPPTSGSAAPDVVGYAPSSPRHQHDEQSVILVPSQTFHAWSVANADVQCHSIPLPPLVMSATTLEGARNPLFHQSTTLPRPDHMYNNIQTFLPQ